MVHPLVPEEGAHHFRPPNPADARDVPAELRPDTRSPGPQAPRPWWRQIARQWPLAITLLGLAVGLGVMMTGHWRRASTLIGLVIVAAAALRWLPIKMVGLLAVRRRWVDTAILLVLGLGILVTAWVVPPIRK